MDKTDYVSASWCVSFCIIIVVTIMIIFYIQYEKNISGLWTSSVAFNKEAGLKQHGMSLFFQKHKFSGGRIKRFMILIIPDEEYTQQITLTYIPRPILWGTGIIKIYPELSDYSSKSSIVFPKNNITFEFNFMKNMLRIYDCKTLYAVLFKDNEATETVDVSSPN